MTNPRYVKGLKDLTGSQFFQMMKLVNRTRPDGMEIPKAAAIPSNKRLPDSELPFVPGDRVQIAKGPDRGKVGTIISRYAALGNCFHVAGVGAGKIINPIESKPTNPDEYDPVVDNYKIFDYKDLRLVSKIKNEDGEDEDVVIHSIKLGPERYDPDANKHIRVRYAQHDKSIVIPYPLNKAKPIESEMTTPALYADTRTHFVTSARDAPIPIGALDQIINPYTKHKRNRYAKVLSASKIAQYEPPKMPIPPKTKKLLEQLESMPKPDRPEFTSEMAAFLDSEIKSGLIKRAEKESENYSSYH